MSKKRSGRKPESRPIADQRPAAKQAPKRSNMPLVVIAALLVGLAAGAYLFGGGSGSSSKAFESDQLGSGLGGAGLVVGNDSRGSIAGSAPAVRAGEPAAVPAEVRTIAAGEYLDIPTTDIGDAAAFFPVEVDGTSMELLAVRASDGSIRTAFNTCQSCYRSGRGYYKWDGGELVCQNCGFRFSPDQVEVQSGGCNPWPIFEDDKTVTEDGIRISYDFLKESSGIFANWKL